MRTGGWPRAAACSGGDEGSLRGDVAEFVAARRKLQAGAPADAGPALDTLARIAARRRLPTEELWQLAEAAEAAGLRTYFARATLARCDAWSPPPPSSPPKAGWTRTSCSKPAAAGERAFRSDLTSDARACVCRRGQLRTVSMKRRLVELLRCPIDGGKLGLDVWESERRNRAELGLVGDSPDFDEEISSGVLVNDRLQILYPIHGGVPRLLVFEHPLNAHFRKQWKGRLERQHPGYSLPDRAAMPGEPNVLRTFSSEWTGYGWRPTAYWNQSAENWFRSMDFVLGLSPEKFCGGRILEVGVGIGGVADHVSRTQRAEVVGVDLGYSVDAAQRAFSANPLLHLVQASAFRPPFAESSFDLVYSFGVLHHTFDTKLAVETVSQLAKRELCVWVYSPENESRTVLRRALMAVEGVARPQISRLPEWGQSLALLPAVPAYMVHQLVQSVRHSGQTRYGFREAMHAARDRLTPPYAHRHTEAELEDWFGGVGFDVVDKGSQMERPDHVPIGFTSNAVVRGVRSHPS